MVGWNQRILLQYNELATEMQMLICKVSPEPAQSEQKAQENLK